GDATRRANARAAGLPVNFFRANPDLQGGGFIRGNGGATRYNAFETEFRQRLTPRPPLNASYALGKAKEAQRFSYRDPQQLRTNGGGEGGIVHAFKFYGIWELPFGNGKKFGSNASGFLDRVIGGWLFTATGRIQSGRQLDF